MRDEAEPYWRALEEEAELGCSALEEEGSLGLAALSAVEVAATDSVATSEESSPRVDWSWDAACGGAGEGTSSSCGARSRY